MGDGYTYALYRKLHNLINVFQLIIEQNNFYDATNFFNQSAAKCDWKFAKFNKIKWDGTRYLSSLEL